MELSALIARGVKDPGVGFITITHVKVSADLQVARAYYTLMGDAAARKETAKALDRATPYLRRQVASRLRLRRAPELVFQFDESIERQQRIEELLQEIRVTDAAAAQANAEADAPVDAPTPAEPSPADTSGPTTSKQADNE